MNSLDVSLQTYHMLSSLYPSLKDPEIEPLLLHLNSAFLENTEKLPNQENLGEVSVYVSIWFVEVRDLRTAFSEGFEGYSVELLFNSSQRSTEVVDINGNKAVFREPFNM